MTDNDAVDVQAAMAFATQFVDSPGARYLPMAVAMMVYRMAPHGKEQKELGRCFVMARGEMRRLIDTIREAHGDVH